jgi:hypothetical protein
MIGMFLRAIGLKEEVLSSVVAVQLFSKQNVHGWIPFEKGLSFFSILLSFHHAALSLISTYNIFKNINK